MGYPSNVQRQLLALSILGAALSLLACVAGRPPSDSSATPAGAAARSATRSANRAGSSDDAQANSQSGSSLEPHDTGSQPTPTRTEAEDETLVLDALAPARGPPLKLTPACFELFGKEKCSGVGAVQLLCGGLGTVMSADAHRRLLSCLEALNGSEKLCRANVLRECGVSAIQNTSQLAQVARSCESLFSHCDSPASRAALWTPELCRAGLSSMLPGPRQEFVECMLDACDLRICLGGLL